MDFPTERMASMTDSGPNCDSPQLPRTLQYTRRGLKMVAEDKALFDLDEPIWHADEKARGWGVGGWILCILGTVY